MIAGIVALYVVFGLATFAYLLKRKVFDRRVDAIDYYTGLFQCLFFWPMLLIVLLLAPVVAKQSGQEPFKMLNAEQRKALRDARLKKTA